MRTTTTPATAGPTIPADSVTIGSVTASITLPKSVILDFYRQCHAYAAEPHGTSWKRYPEFNALYSGSWDIEWKTKDPYNKPQHGVASPKARLAEIHKRMKSEPFGQIHFQISGDLWEKVQTVARHYGITPEDHCRSCFGYYAALWRKEAKKAGALTEAAHHDPRTPATAEIIPFMPHRANRRWNIPAIA